MTALPTATRAILVVDDHAIVRRGLALMIDQEVGLRVTGEAHDLASAITVLTHHDFDLAVVDLSLGTSSGLGVIRHIASAYPAMRIVVLSMQDESIWLERCMAAGAHAFVGKETATEQLVTAIRRVLEGAVYLSETAQARLVQGMQGMPGKASESESRIHSLSARELEVLHLIGQGLGTAQIAQTLSRSPKTIETHKEHIKTKLGLDSANALARYAMRWESAKSRHSRF